MSAIDKVFSFAKSREADACVIQDGFTYGDMRQLRLEIERLNEWGKMWRDQVDSLSKAFQKLGNSAREEIWALLKAKGVLPPAGSET